MPASSNFIEPNKDRFNQDYYKEYQERFKVYKNTRKYYLGDHLRPYLNNSQDYKYWVVLNYVKITADRVAGFLFPDYPKIIVENNKSVETKLNDFIHQIGLNFFIEIVINAFLNGHSFIYNNFDDVDNPTILLLPNPSVTVFWHPVTRKILWYEMKTEDEEFSYLTDIINNDNSWIIREYKGDKNVANNYFNTYQSDVSLLQQKDYKLEKEYIRYSRISPILDLQYSPNPFDFYGLSDLPNLDLQNTINRIMSQINAIAAELGEPVDVLIGSEADDVDETKQGVIAIANPSAKVQRLELKTDLNLNLNVLKTLIDQFLYLVRVVLLRGDVEDFQRVTNTSVRMLMMDMLIKNKQLQDGFRRLIESLCLLYLQATGTYFPKKGKINIEFANPIPMDYKDMAEVISKLVEMGVWSKERAFNEIGGIDWAEEAQRIAEEKTSFDLTNENL